MTYYYISIYYIIYHYYQVSYLYYHVPYAVHIILYISTYSYYLCHDCIVYHYIYHSSRRSYNQHSIAFFLLYAIQRYYSIIMLRLQSNALHNLLSVSNVMFSVLLFSKLLIACLLSPVALHISFCLKFLSIIICLIPLVISSILLYLISIINPPKG